MKIVLYILGGLLLCGLLVYVIGLFLPAEHVAEGERVVAGSTEAAAARIREVEAHPKWRRGVKSIEIVTREPAALLYREHGGHGPMLYRFREVEAGRRFESVIADEKLPFGGRWILTLEPAEGGTKVRIREEGVVRAPVFRTLSRFVFGHEGTLRAYLEDLAAASGPLRGPASGG